MQKGLSINALNNGKTPLHVAASSGNNTALFYLLKEGASVNVKDSEGETPLHLAVKFSDIQSVNHLLSYAADINAINNQGLKPIAYVNHLA